MKEKAVLAEVSCIGEGMGRRWAGEVGVPMGNGDGHSLSSISTPNVSSSAAVPESTGLCPTPSQDF